MNRDCKNVLLTEIESNKQVYLYNISHIDVCFQISIGEYEDGTGYETRNALDKDMQICIEENKHTRHNLI